ncbi:hypothetical protein HK105_205773 [Polyrhizophydium stewartii]|uniref:Uncharacterized protein n=1 Tax=Polyrhizophydium stewartii TaxID=2732419 RepID=A0ABR4N551_9FUNG
MFGARKGLFREPRASKDSTTLEVRSFFASTTRPPGDSFAPSTRVVGRFQLLRTLSAAPWLCEYVDISKTSHGRMYVVSEGGRRSLATLLSKSPAGCIRSLALLRRWALGIVEALAYLHEHGVVHRNLRPKNVLVDQADRIRLSDFGLYYLTGCGQDVAFPVGCPHYLAPETIAAGPMHREPSSPKTDVWALGVLLLELYFGTHVFGPDLSNIVGIFHMIMAWSDHGPAQLAQEPDIDPLFADFVRQCLCPRPADRPSSAALFGHPFLDPDTHSTASEKAQPAAEVIGPQIWFKRPHLFEDRLAISLVKVSQSQSDSTLPPSTPSADVGYSSGLSSGDRGQFATAPGRYPLLLTELVHYWRMLGGDLDSLVIKTGIANVPATSRLPALVRSGENVEEVLAAQQDFNLYNDAPTLLPLDAVWSKLDAFEKGLIKGDTATYRDDWKHIPSFSAANMERIWESWNSTAGIKLSLAAREADLSYQYFRTRSMYRLLCKYPSSASLIRHEAVSDIPPLLRGRIWAALLQVRGDTDALYAAFDKDTEADTDRQYNELLSSPVGHAKLKRILKAWIECERGRHVYWQGLDSMCAPFLALNFDDEALAFASMRSFISSFCQGFFVHDNSKLMREFMLAFRYILSFHDPELSSHLHSIGLGPELFAISWFMTLYAHVFPLDKIFHLWDLFLVGPQFMFIFVGVSILQQHRDQLLESDFNQAMMLFSEMPAVNVEQCIIYSIQAAKITPPSILSHLQADHASSPQDHNAWDVIKRFSFMNNKRGIVGGISLSDFLELRRWAVVLDTRALESFKEGHAAGSIHVVTDQLQSLSFGLKIALARGRFIVVVSSGSEESNQASLFAALLVREKQPRVSLLVVTEPDVLLQSSHTGFCKCAPQPSSGYAEQGVPTAEPLPDEPLADEALFVSNFKLFWPEDVRPVKRAAWLLGWLIGPNAACVAGVLPAARTFAQELVEFQELDRPGDRPPPSVIGIARTPASSKDSAHLRELEERLRSTCSAWISVALDSTGRIPAIGEIDFGASLRFVQGRYTIFYSRPSYRSLQYFSTYPLVLDLSQINGLQDQAYGDPEHDRVQRAAMALKMGVHVDAAYSAISYPPSENIEQILGKINAAKYADRVIARIARAHTTKPRHGAWGHFRRAFVQHISRPVWRAFLSFASAILFVLRVAIDMMLWLLNLNLPGTAVSLVKLSTALQQIDLRLQQLQFWPAQYAMWSLSSTKLSAKAQAQYIGFFNTVWLIANDIIIGLALGTVLVDYRYPIARIISVTLHSLTIETVDTMITWLMGCPGGLKLNVELNSFLGELFGWLVLSWSELFVAAANRLPAVIYVIGHLGVFGATMPIAVFMDLVMLSTMHLHLFYTISAKMYYWQVAVIQSLFTLFQGKKRNALRKRVDSAEYDLDQLLLGTCFFTLLVFLFPTVGVYYLLFCIYRIGVVLVHAAFEIVLAFFNHFPLFALMLRVKDPLRLPQGIQFEPQLTQMHR